MSLAPISISTYSRLEHLTKTIESLQKNTLAKESVLYIFSDAPKNGDEEVVKKVRDYLYTISGFKEIHIIEQKTNNIKKNINNIHTKKGNQIFQDTEVKLFQLLRVFVFITQF